MKLFGADGKAIKHVKRRLKPSLRFAGGHLGAGCVGGLEPADGLAAAMVGDLDGEAGEAALDPRPVCRSRRRRPARGSNGWWCWTYFMRRVPAAGVEAGATSMALFSPDHVRPDRSWLAGKKPATPRGMDRSESGVGWARSRKVLAVIICVCIMTHLRDGKDT